MSSSPTDFSIVTPSFNMLGYLKRCSASVADQRGASHEHIVVDAGSTDGTAPWLAGQVLHQSPYRLRIMDRVSVGENP